MPEERFEDGEPPGPPVPTAVEFAIQGVAEPGGAEEAGVVVVRGVGTDGSAVWQVRRHGPGEGDGGRVETPWLAVGG